MLGAPNKDRGEGEAPAFHFGGHKIFGALDFSKMNGPQGNRYSLKIFLRKANRGRGELNTLRCIDSTMGWPTEISGNKALGFRKPVPEAILG